VAHCFWVDFQDCDSKSGWTGSVSLYMFRFTCFALHVSLYISSLGGPQISKIILTKLQFCVFVCQVAWYWRFIQGFWITEASNDRFIFTF
jgi:hypothetical protein